MAARRDPEMARRVRESLDLRGDKLAELVTEAQATGAIDPSLDKEAVVRFCHALGFGFLLFRAIELDLPDPEPWERLISHLVDSLDVTADTDRHRPPTYQGEPRDDHQRRDARPSRRQRPRGDPRDHRQGRRRDGPRREGQRRRAVHVELREGRAPRAQQALREGQGRAVERRDRPPVGHARRHREGRGQRAGRPRERPGARPGPAPGWPLARLGREGVADAPHREPELDDEPVHARRAGRAGVHRQDRRDGAVDRRQVLRRHPGDGRGPPRRGVRQVPRHEARTGTTRSTPTSGCSSTTSSRTPAGT